MTTPPRPIFYEGQVLAAADLTATVEHARARAARHDRYLHDWGIAEGLELTTEPRTDPDTGAQYVQVTVQPGLAVDGTGREILVPAPVALQEAAFRETNGADQPTTQPYPVFLTGLDRDPPTQPLVTTSRCAGAGHNARVEESCQIVFGRLGEESTVADHPRPAVGTGPGDERDPWPVLLGFVHWQDGHIVAAMPASGSVGRRLAGVRADTVAARSGRLVLRADPAVEQGRPALVLDGDKGLTFGRQRGDGSVDRLLEVSTAGDLFLAGAVSAKFKAGQVAVASGTTTDGMLLPLPTGVLADNVAQGRVELHVRVTPRLARTAAIATGTWVAGPADCTVDTHRRVLSQVQWVRVDVSPVEVIDLAAPVDYLVVATIAADAPGGSGSGASAEASR